jgi:hypothetical protein
MSGKYSQPMPPTISSANPPTLPFHQNSEATGRELHIGATKNDKTATEKVPNPSARRLFLINANGA